MGITIEVVEPEKKLFAVQNKIMGCIFLPTLNKEYPTIMINRFGEISMMKQTLEESLEKHMERTAIYSPFSIHFE